MRRRRGLGGEEEEENRKGKDIGMGIGRAREG